MQRRKYVYCEDHEFVIRPLKKDAYFSCRISASFCKGKFQENHEKFGCDGSKNNCSCVPIFNRDENCMTNAFISPLDQVLPL